MVIMRKLKMKKLFIALSLLAFSSVLYANCRIHIQTYIQDGKTVVCECMICANFTECNCK